MSLPLSSASLVSFVGSPSWGSWVGGDAGFRAGCIVAGLVCFFGLALLLPQKKIRRDRKRASREVHPKITGAVSKKDQAEENVR